MNYFTQNCKEQQEETLIHVAFCSPALFLGFRSYNWRIWANRNKLRPLYQQDSIFNDIERRRPEKLHVLNPLICVHARTEWHFYTSDSVILLLYINRKTQSVLPNNKKKKKPRSYTPFCCAIHEQFSSQQYPTSTTTATKHFNPRETWRSRGAWRNKPGFWSFLWRFCYLYSSVYRTPDSVTSCGLISGKSPDDESCL